MLLIRVLGGGLGVIFWILSIKTLSLTIASTIFNTIPIWTTILARIFISESFTYMKLFSLLLSFFGVLLIIKPNFIFVSTEADAINYYGILMAILFALSAAIVNISLRNLGQRI